MLSQGLKSRLELRERVRVPGLSLRESFSLMGYQLTELYWYMSSELTKITGGSHSSEHVCVRRREEKHAIDELHFL